VTNSSAIPVPFRRNEAIPVDSGAIPPDSGGFRTELPDSGRNLWGTKKYRELALNFLRNTRSTYLLVRSMNNYGNIGQDNKDLLNSGGNYLKLLGQRK
jgi:hypothetical protein